MRTPPLKILATVYNPIEYDGRVQRACEALSSTGEVTVVSIDAGGQARNAAFRTIGIRLLSKARGPAAHLWFWFHLWIIALRIRPDVIHAHDFFMAFPGWVAAKLMRAKLVYDAHELIVPDAGERISPRDRFWYLLERWTVKRADLIIAANAERAQVMRAHYKLARAPLVIRNIPPPPSSILSAEEVTQKYPVLRRAKDDCVVVYQGDVSISRGLDKFIEAIVRLPNEFRLIVIGTGLDEQRLRADVEARDISRVFFTGRVPREDLYDLLRQCDIGIVTYAEAGRNNLLCAPNKVYEYAQAGLLLMCSENPILSGILANYQIGLAARQMEDIVDALRQLYAKREQFRPRLTRFLNENQWTAEAERLRLAFARLQSPSGDPA